MRILYIFYDMDDAEIERIIIDDVKLAGEYGIDVDVAKPTADILDDIGYDLLIDLSEEIDDIERYTFQVI